AVQELSVDEIDPAGDVFRVILPFKPGDVVLDKGLARHHLVKAADGACLFHHLRVDLPPSTRRYSVSSREFLNLEKQRVATWLVHIVNIVRKKAGELRVVIGMRGVEGLLGKQQRPCR